MILVVEKSGGGGGGDPFTVEVEMFETIHEIKKKIHHHQGIPVSQQTIFFRGAALSDDIPVIYTDIFVESRVQLVVAAADGGLNAHNSAITGQYPIPAAGYQFPSRDGANVHNSAAADGGLNDQNYGIIGQSPIPAAGYQFPSRDGVNVGNSAAENLGSGGDFMPDVFCGDLDFDFSGILRQPPVGLSDQNSGAGLNFNNSGIDLNVHNSGAGINFQNSGSGININNSGSGVNFQNSGVLHQPPIDLNVQNSGAGVNFQNSAVLHQSPVNLNVNNSGILRQPPAPLNFHNSDKFHARAARAQSSQPPPLNVNNSGILRQPPAPLNFHNSDKFHTHAARAQSSQPPPKETLRCKITNSEKIVEIEINALDTIHSLKHKITTKLATPQQQLIINADGKDLIDDQKTVQDYQISKNSDVKVSYKARTTVNRPPLPRHDLIKVVVEYGGMRSEVEVRGGECVRELREKVKKMKIKLPEGSFFFIHKQSVMEEEQSFRWNNVSAGDTIELFPGYITN